MVAVVLAWAISGAWVAGQEIWQISMQVSLHCKTALCSSMAYPPLTLAADCTLTQQIYPDPSWVLGLACPYRIILLT